MSPRLRESLRLREANRRELLAKAKHYQQQGMAGLAHAYQRAANAERKCIQRALRAQRVSA
jgi:hypothetical protein